MLLALSLFVSGLLALVGVWACAFAGFTVAAFVCGLVCLLCVVFVFVACSR